jgi:hypothetical protein
MKKGLLVFTLRKVGLGDGTLNGVSSRYGKFILTGEGIPEIFEPDENTPELRYIHWVAGSKIARPPVEGSEHFSFGGNHVYTSDSRFPNDYPIPVFDRDEGKMSPSEGGVD